mmetsp:Transcript_21815/g.51747  ORF Transcript_21815/g.51747 Transcript_21815/m.51747 type:complete len:230 (+) Transcript_21815:212-901(+)|eukprot:CAMPEP_0172395606 /NCGR_PEP_ID=MMETSP1061-20121228/20577_1 /TAXON_ID=37318 /ORGANISM="Pseudo-nitzschia pungens, Strain cf. pungens" /LENGTH=229 /DNA_ID=CAMNT_0013127241 /DNA_START=107 /DNA_END=796 /DNA_ORIENTATION=-
MNLSTASSIIAIVALASNASAFTPVAQNAKATALRMGTPGMDLSGNSWKPDSEKMGSTDTGDYFPEGYNPEQEIAFSSGMMGSQASNSGNRDGPQLPGLENLGADAVVAGGITLDPNIPEGMEFVPASVPDGEFSFSVASTGGGGALQIMVSSPCMTFEDYYAAFAPGSHPSLSVTPSAGRLDRRSGEPTAMEIICDPNGASGALTGDLVINLPDDNSKLSYKVSVQSN